MNITKSYLLLNGEVLKLQQNYEYRVIQKQVNHICVDIGFYCCLQRRCHFNFDYWVTEIQLKYPNKIFINK